MTDLNDMTVREAVDDEDWQTLRLMLRGKSTQYKIAQLQDWLKLGDYQGEYEQRRRHLQVDNYLKALARGGILKPGAHVDEKNCMHYEVKS